MSIVNELKEIAIKLNKDFESTYMDIQSALLKNIVNNYSLHI